MSLRIQIPGSGMYKHESDLRDLIYHRWEIEALGRKDLVVHVGMGSSKQTSQSPHFPALIISTLFTMDAHYDFENAKNTLETLITDRASGPSALKLVSNFDKIPSHEVTILASNYPRCWRLVRSHQDGESEEMVLRIPGILCGKDLPPVLVKPNNHRNGFLGQRISLTGLGASSFTSIIDSISTIAHLFSREFSEASFNSWKPMLWQQHQSLGLSNRYFSPAKGAPSEEIIPLPPFIDPKRILADIMGNYMVHTKENEVSYFEKCVRGSNTQYKAIEPTKFRIGDIVEAQMSFIVIPVQSHFNLILVLRSLALLDAAFSSEAMIKRNRSTVNSLPYTVPVVTSLKRKIGYMEDEEEEVALTRRKLAELGVKDTIMDSE